VYLVFIYLCSPKKYSIQDKIININAYYTAISKKR
jgi:hypothetical protein